MFASYASDTNSSVMIGEEATPVVSSTQQVGKKITGTILDETGLPIIGANVVEKGTTNGTITDMDGKFSINVSSGDAILVGFLYRLYRTTTVGNKQKDWSLVLKEDLQNLDEVVVVGYGTQRKGILRQPLTDDQVGKYCRIVR